MISSIALFTFTALSVANADTHSFGLTDITKVEVHNSSGDVKVIGVTSGQAIVTATKKQFGSHCKMTIEQRQATLFVEVRQAENSFFGCDVDFEIKAPQAAKLELSSGSGDLTIQGTSGDLEFRTGSGDVIVDGEIKTIMGKAGSGDVSIKGLTTGGTIVTGSGKMKLVFSIPPAIGELELKTGSGDAEVVLPKAARVRTSLAVGSGKIRNEVGNDASSKFKITARSGSGDLKVRSE
ncbi:MAG: DUF4097 family beta strand repeat-containing protein [Bdellovibrionales bacterium]